MIIIYIFVYMLIRLRTNNSSDKSCEVSNKSCDVKMIFPKIYISEFVIQLSCTAAREYPV